MVDTKAILCQPDFEVIRQIWRVFTRRQNVMLSYLRGGRMFNPLLGCVFPELIDLY